MKTSASTITYAADSGRKEGLMASTFESQVREFAAEFSTPNVQRAVALCEAGTLSWEQVHGLFKQSLGHALTKVGA